MRRHQPRVSSFQAGVIAAVLIAIVCYLVFGGSLPFSGKPFVLKATFTTQTELHIPSPVRIAGVDVGEVTGVNRIARQSSASIVTMDIDANGLPIHSDAAAKIRPRIFLEGNFYVDLQPGSPSAPTLKSGSTLPAPSTAGPVQLDRVLAALTTDPRGNLQTLLQGLGAALDGTPTAAEDASQDPITRALTGGQALNLSLKYSPEAFRASTLVNEALLGVQPHDLSKVVLGNERVLRALAASDGSLSSLVTTFNATMATLASRQTQLEQTISLLPPLLVATNTSDAALDRSFPPTIRFARAFLPGVKQLGPTIDAGIPWLQQATALTSPQELGGLLKDVSPAVRSTASSLNSTKALLRSSDLLARCFSHNVIPAGNEVINDPPSGTGLPVYEDLFQTAVGIAGASQNFDGNGRYTRASAGGGSLQVQTPVVSTDGPLYGNAVLPPLGTRPAFVGKAPPLRRDVACYTNAVANVNSVRTGVGP